MSATVVPIRFGEIVKVPNSAGANEPHMIAHNCGKDPFPAFYDDSCDLKFANLGNLLIHLEDHGEGPHRIVAFCKTHRWFEEISAAQAEGFVKAGVMAA